ncbi:MAG TPA: cohesin domain-containing protein [Myxococcota bacterium]|nr:cohesin domain-containing protein [Myxococcota bacterium]
MRKRCGRHGQGRQGTFLRAGAVPGGGGWFRLRAGLALGLAAASFLAGGPVHALSLSLAPTAVTQDPGLDFSLVLSVGGFGESGTARLQAFTVKLAYDPALLELVSTAFGSQLGVPPTTALANATAAAGVVTLTENSLLSAAALNAQQPSTFDLATLTFRGLTPGAGAVSLFTDSFTELVLTDLSLAPFDSPLPAVTITITPEPASAILLTAGLAALAARARRNTPTSDLLEDADSAP